MNSKRSYDDDIVEPQDYDFEIKANGRFKIFVPGVCVPHKWVPVVTSNATTVTEYCSDSGAVCVRDESGSIVEYDRLANYGPGRPGRLY